MNKKKGGEDSDCKRKEKEDKRRKGQQKKNRKQNLTWQGGIEKGDNKSECQSG